MNDEKKRGEILRTVRAVVSIIGAVLIIIEGIENLRKKGG